MSIDSRFHDLGFGNKEVDLTSAPNDTNLLTYANNGFGNPDVLTIGSDKYNNTREFNFGSKSNIESQQKYISIQYENIFERGSIKVNRNNFAILNIKNKFIRNPTLVLSPQRFNLNRDVNLYYEKHTSRSFKVFNDADRKITIDYVATKTNKKIKDISSEIVNNSVKVNEVINESLEIVQSIVPKYDTSILVDKNINEFNTTPTLEWVSNLTLHVNHSLVVSNSGGQANFNVGQVAKTNNSFFKFNVSTLQGKAVTIRTYDNDLLLYLLADPDDENTKQLQTLGTNGYQISLVENTTYYFWYDGPSYAWFVSTDRFPNQIIYI